MKQYKSSVRKSGKIYLFKQPQSQDSPSFEDDNGQIPLPECRAILCRDGATYTDEEIILIRRALYSWQESIICP
jgi:hypothetical protein